jgi:hypothetical protein
VVLRLRDTFRFSYMDTNTHTQSRGSIVGIALGYELDDRSSGNWELSLHHRIQTGSGAHPASYPMAIKGSFPGVKRPGRETDHSLLYLHSPIHPLGVVFT